MLSNTSLFRDVACPFYASGLCQRPFCHFKHVRTDSLHVLRAVVAETVKEMLGQLMTTESWGYVAVCGSRQPPPCACGRATVAPPVEQEEERVPSTRKRKYDAALDLFGQSHQQHHRHHQRHHHHHDDGGANKKARPDEGSNDRVETSDDSDEVLEECRRIFQEYEDSKQDRRAESGQPKPAAADEDPPKRQVRIAPVSNVAQLLRAKRKLLETFKKRLIRRSRSLLT